MNRLHRQPRLAGLSVRFVAPTASAGTPGDGRAPDAARHSTPASKAATATAMNATTTTKRCQAGETGFMTGNYTFSAPDNKPSPPHHRRISMEVREIM